MKQEYKDKIELAKKLLHYDESISQEEFEKNFDIAYKIIIKELVITGDEEILCELIDIFNEENEEYGICETLEHRLYENFNFDQIIKVLYKKLDYLLINDIFRAPCIIWRLFRSGKFNDFRNVFNKIKSKKSNELLARLDDLNDSNKFLEKEISILRDDMKKW
jgi:hypothetical protein